MCIAAFMSEEFNFLKDLNLCLIISRICFAALHAQIALFHDTYRLFSCAYIASFVVQIALFIAASVVSIPTALALWVLAFSCNFWASEVFLLGNRAAFVPINAQAIQTHIKNFVLVCFTACFVCLGATPDVDKKVGIGTYTSALVTGTCFVFLFYKLAHPESTFKILSANRIFGLMFINNHVVIGLGSLGMGAGFRLLNLHAEFSSTSFSDRLLVFFSSFITLGGILLSHALVVEFKSVALWIARLVLLTFLLIYPMLVTTTAPFWDLFLLSGFAVFFFLMESFQEFSQLKPEKAPTPKERYSENPNDDSTEFERLRKDSSFNIRRDAPRPGARRDDDGEEEEEQQEDPVKGGTSLQDMVYF
jgi:hypothetical protein